MLRLAAMQPRFKARHQSVFSQVFFTQLLNLFLHIKKAINTICVPDAVFIFP